MTNLDTAKKILTALYCGQSLTRQYGVDTEPFQIIRAFITSEQALTPQGITAYHPRWRQYSKIQMLIICPLFAYLYDGHLLELKKQVKATNTPDVWLAIAHTTRLALQAQKPSTYLQSVLRFVEPDDNLYRAILRVGHVLTWGSESRALTHLEKGATVENALFVTVLYGLITYGDNVGDLANLVSCFEQDSATARTLAVALSVLCFGEQIVDLVIDEDHMLPEDLEQLAQKLETRRMSISL